MFTQLRIQNFKAWKDTGNIRLAPLTVFFGPNSSGKTSLLQFLLLLKQTSQSPDRRLVLNLGGDSRSLVDFGIWPEVVFAHDAQRSFCFELQWQLPETPTYRYSRPKQFMSFEAEIATSAEAVTPMVKMFRYGFNPLGWGEFSFGMSRVVSRDGGYEFWYRDDMGRVQSPRKPGMKEQLLPAPIHFYGFPLETRVYYKPDVFTDDAEFHFVQQLDSIRYLGPLRQMPRRFYAWTGGSPEDVGSQGEQVVEAILAARKREFQPEHVQGAVSFEALIAQWLGRMGLLEDFVAKPLAPHRKEYEVLVRASGSRESVNLVDVGFGISQVLPVLVQLFYVDRNSVLIFEQPEIHLHPRAQSELADLFIEAAQMKEGGLPRRVQLLVESHSEHFLRRLQRRIAEGLLAPEQIALYFCKSGPDGSTIEELQVDKYGRISNWPENFFGDAIGDTEQQMDAMLRRMEEEEPNASG